MTTAIFGYNSGSGIVSGGDTSLLAHVLANNNATFTGVVTKFGFLTPTSGVSATEIKLALYNGSTEGASLQVGYVTKAISGTDTWHEITVPRTTIIPVTSGNPYYVAYHANNVGSVAWDGAGAIYSKLVYGLTYANSMPATLPAMSNTPFYWKSYLYAEYNDTTGFLTVTISPQGAIDAGCQWSIDGGTTKYNSGQQIWVGTAESPTLSFYGVGEWTPPSNQSPSIIANTNTNAEGVFTGTHTGWAIDEENDTIWCYWLDNAYFEQAQSAFQFDMVIGDSYFVVVVCSEYTSGDVRITQICADTELDITGTGVFLKEVVCTSDTNNARFISLASGGFAGTLSYVGIFKK